MLKVVMDMLQASYPMIQTFYGLKFFNLKKKMVV